MEKLTSTAVEIREEIQRRIDACDALEGDCKGCRAPTPRWTDPDLNNGCNWTIDVIPGCIPGCFDFVTAITRQVMNEYSLLE
jgi:hypothetical protein